MNTYNQKAFKELAAFFRNHGLFPDGTAFSKKVLLALYRMIAEGQPVKKEALATRLNIDELELDEVLESLPPSNIAYDEAGYIVGYRGLSQRASPHQLRVKGVNLYAWCAFDCLFLPELLGCKLEVKSLCPETKEGIRLTLSPNSIDKTSSKTIFVSFVTPDLDAYKGDLRGNFCRHVNFFSSEKSGASWITQNEGTVLLSIEEAFVLARIRNKSGFGSTLDSNLHPT